MSHNPLVSIVIPVYNGSNFMREAIDSALAQTYPNIEILVVNDGSTDNTREIALSYGDKIRYFEKENGGVATALNLAIHEMKGEYFSWLSHDDWYTPDKVEMEIRALQAGGDMNRAVYSECDFVSWPDGARRPTGCSRFGRDLAEVGWFAVIMGLISGCTLLIPKAYVDIYGGFDTSMRAVNDYEQWFRMFKDRKLVYVDKSLVGSRVHEGQVTSTYQGMRDEEDRMYAWMLEELQQVDTEASGIGHYQLYSMKLAQWVDTPGLDRVRATLIRFLRDMDEPVVPAYIETDENWYVYCAGRAARRFIRNLRWRGISVSAVSDSNPARWGTDVDGVPCIPPEEIPRDARVIVANAQPDAVMAQLRDQGFSHVESYQDWQRALLMTPIKKSCCEVLA